MVAQPRPDATTPLRLVPQPQRKAAIYLRVSTTGQEDNASLATQEAAYRACAAQRGYRVEDADVYREVHTGAELWERPRMTALREAVRGREVAAVIAHAIDRLSRKQAHVAIVADECERAGAALLFATEEFEKSATGEFIRSAKAFAAEVEREKIQERTQRGIETRVRSGRPLPGTRPLYGYTWRDERKSALVIDRVVVGGLLLGPPLGRRDERKSALVIDPRTAAVVRRIFADAAAGQSLRAIARALTAEGVPTPTDKGGWKQSTVHAIVRHPGYAGVAEARRYKVEKVPGKKRRVTLREAGASVALPAGTIPPLVSRETFDAVQARLAHNRATSPGRLGDPEAFLLRGGFVRCGYCGHAVSAMWRVSRATGARSPIYTLSTSCDSHRGCRSVTMAAGELDAVVWEYVERILRRPELIARHVEELRANDTTAGQLASIDRTLAEIARKQANLARQLALFDDDEAGAPLRAEIASLGRHRQQVEADRAGVAERRRNWEAAQERMARLETWCRRVAANLGEMTYEQRRLALAALGVRVKLYRRDHEPRVEATAEIPLDGAEHEAPTTLVDSVSRTHAGHRRYRVARWTAHQVVPRHPAFPDRGPAKRSPAGPDRPACPLLRSSRALVDRWGGVVVAVYVHYHERASLSSPAAGKSRFPFAATAYIG